MFNPDNISEVGQMLSDQIGDYITQSSSRKPALIEPDVYDDEQGTGYDPLNRWGDCRIQLNRSRWSEIGHPMDSWKS